MAKGSVSRQAFRVQRGNAKSRGITWDLTFQEWLEWWGEDINRRGKKAGCLQMCRRDDVGPYALWNIFKGTPKDNRATDEKIRKSTHRDLRIHEWRKVPKKQGKDIKSESRVYKNEVERMKHAWRYAPTSTNMR